MSARVLFGGGGRYYRDTVVTDTRRRHVLSKWPNKKKTVFSVQPENFYRGYSFWTFDHDPTTYFIYSHVFTLPLTNTFYFVFCLSRRPTTYLARPVALFRI